MNRLRLTIFIGLTVIFAGLSLTLAHGYSLSHFWRNTASANLIQSDKDPRSAGIDCAVVDYAAPAISGWPLAWSDGNGPMAFLKDEVSCPFPSSRVNVVALVIDLLASALLSGLVTSGVGMIIDRKPRRPFTQQP
jgi:hypothetical protein